MRDVKVTTAHLYESRSRIKLENSVERVVSDAEICSGKPVIRGTRIMVRNILGMISGGYSRWRILEAYPQLTAEDVSAALQYAAEVIDEEQVIAR